MKRQTKRTQKLLDQVARFKDVMQAWVDGKPIQYKLGDGWMDFTEYEEPSWLLGYDYRIKPKTPLQIPWELIDKKYQWAAKSEAGHIFLYSNRPFKAINRFVADRGYVTSIPLVNINPDDIPWQDSLVKRPADKLEE
ncbi:hypothetical protein SXHG_00032 [Synechococcus phage MRHenn-2013a]|nr:hypothetical protein SXHG_00032 [Synechococcus phage MRHenn-2013a]